MPHLIQMVDAYATMVMVKKMELDLVCSVLALTEILKVITREDVNARIISSSIQQPKNA